MDTHGSHLGSKNKFINTSENIFGSCIFVHTIWIPGTQISSQASKGRRRLACRRANLACMHDVIPNIDQYCRTHLFHMPFLLKNNMLAETCGNWFKLEQAGGCPGCQEHRPWFGGGCTWLVCGEHSALSCHSQGPKLMTTFIHKGIYTGLHKLLITLHSNQISMTEQQYCCMYLPVASLHSRKSSC